MKESSLIKAVVIDDEANIVSLICDLIKEYCPQVKIIGTANSVKSGIDCIEKCRPDLVFMDIAMPDGTGFNIIEELEYNDFEVVFITAYDNYAIKAFEFSAIHYILKPVDHTHLTEVVKRYIKNKQIDNLESRMSLLSQNLQNKEKRIMIQTQQETRIVEVDDILYCKSDSNYTTFYLKDDVKFVSCKAMNNYNRLLSDFGFYRIHQSLLVNLKQIKSFVNRRGGYVIMKDGSELDVSRRKKTQFLQILEDYTFRL
ncbi:MAG: LytTR family DNA-binding domain-containing protein [Saprospiraceae bacterium]|nr:LytTR family DNA-binding domain-containing protein [Saprospiraceae bacterium]